MTAIKTRMIYEKYFPPKPDPKYAGYQEGPYFLAPTPKLPGSVFVSLEGDQVTISSGQYQQHSEDKTTYHIEQIRNVISFLDEVKK